MLQLELKLVVMLCLQNPGSVAEGTNTTGNTAEKKKTVGGLCWLGGYHYNLQSVLFQRMSMLPQQVFWFETLTLHLIYGTFPN